MKSNIEIFDKDGKSLDIADVSGCSLPVKSEIEKIITSDYRLTYGNNGSGGSLESRKEGAIVIVNWILNNR